MARADSMAAIDAALQGIPTQRGNVQAANQSVIAPHPAPGVASPTPISNAGKMTADEKRFADAQRQAQTDEEKRAAKFSAEQKAKEDAFNKSASATANAVQGIVKGTGVAVASLPTPGSLMLPLVILLVFFFLLLPVNGHTRLVWLWLVLTGNAEVQQGSGATNAPAIPSAAQVTQIGNGIASDIAPINPIASNVISNLTTPASWLAQLGSWVEELP